MSYEYAFWKKSSGKIRRYLNQILTAVYAIVIICAATKILPILYRVVTVEEGTFTGRLALGISLSVNYCLWPVILTPFMSLMKLQERHFKDLSQKKVYLVLRIVTMILWIIMLNILSRPNEFNVGMMQLGVYGIFKYLEDMIGAIIIGVVIASINRMINKRIINKEIEDDIIFEDENKVEMNYCINCGNQLDEVTNFCSECGKRVVKGNSAFNINEESKS